MENTLIVAVPDNDMKQRLELHEPDVTVVTWRPENGPQPLEPIDLLILPYMTTAEYLSQLSDARVQVIQSQMLGHEGVSRWLPKHMTYCNAVDVHESSTAELALALILASQRGLPTFLNAQRRQHWSSERTPGLAGAHVYIVGAGGVGQQIVSRLVAFGARTTLFGRSNRMSELGPIRAVSELQDSLSAADVVVLAVPLDASTRGLVDREFLSAMRPGALLVNVSRGPVVNTEDLCEFAARGHVRAALDVVDPEPLPADHALWNIPDVIITPHVGGNTESMTARIDPLVLEQIRRLRHKEPPLHVVVDAGG